MSSQAAPYPSDTPLVTIITPVLNCVDYIRECVDSVLHQTYPFVEHVIADGASTDGTLEILQAYAAHHPGRVVVTSRKDSAAGEAFNRALDMARGDIFGEIGADDILLPTAVEEVVRFMQRQPECHVLHGACHYIDDAGARLRTQWPAEFTLKQLINDRNFVSFPSTFYRRQVVERVGPFDHYGNDYDYVIRMAKQFEFHRLQVPLAAFRLRPGSETSSTQFDGRVRRLDYLVVRKHGAHVLSRNCRRYYAFLLAKRLRLLRPYYSLISPIRRRLSVARS